MSIPVIQWVLERATVKGAAWQVLVVMADSASDDGSGTYRSRQTIALAANLSEKAVREAWSALEADRWIIDEGRSRYGTNSWRINLDREFTAAETEQKLTRAEKARRQITPGTNSPPGTHGRPGTDGTPGTHGADPGTSGSEPRYPRSPEPSIEPSQPSVPRETPLRHSGKAVPAARLALAEQLLERFNAAAGTSYGARTGTGKATQALSRILTALTEHPAITAAVGEQMIAAAFAKPWWTGNPQPGVVFGPGAVEGNLQAATDHGPAESMAEYAARINAIHDALHQEAAA